MSRKKASGIVLPKWIPHKGRRFPKVGDRVVCTEIGIGGTIEYVDREMVQTLKDIVLCRDLMRPVQVRLDRPYVSGNHFEPPTTMWRVGMNEYTEES